MIQIQGGISYGESIVIIYVAFKPSTSTIGQVQETVTRDGKELELRGKVGMLLVYCCVLCRWSKQ